MTFEMDEHLLKLEMDRAILYGESCMLEYDIQIAKLQEDGLLTESSIESLQYLLEAATSESGFGGLISKIKEVFSNFLKKFTSKDNQQKFNRNVKQLGILVSSGTITMDDAIELCATPEEIDQLNKMFNSTIDDVQEKINNGTAGAAEKEELSKAISDMKKSKEDAGVTLGEDDAETKKVLGQLVDRGYDGIVGRAGKISTNVNNILEAANTGLKATLEKYGVETTKTVVGGVINDKRKDANPTTAKVSVNKTGAEIASDVATAATGRAKFANPQELKDELEELKKKAAAAKAEYEQKSNNGTVQGDAIDALKNKWDSAEGEVKKKEKEISQLGTNSFDKEHEAVDKKVESHKGGAYASNANIQEYREAHHLFLQYVELYAMLEGKYAIECDRTIAKLGQRDDALDSYKNSNVSVIDRRILEKKKELEDAKKNGASTDEIDRIQKELNQLEEHRKDVEEALSDSPTHDTESKMEDIKRKMSKAKERADKADERLAKSNDGRTTFTDVSTAVNSNAGVKAFKKAVSKGVEPVKKAVAKVKDTVDEVALRKPGDNIVQTGVRKLLRAVKPKTEEQKRTYAIDDLRARNSNLSEEEAAKRVDARIRAERKKARGKSNGE